MMPVTVRTMLSKLRKLTQSAGRWLLYALLAVLIFVTGLVTTDLGSRFAFWLAEESVDGLTINGVSGRLSNKLSIAYFNLQVGGVQVMVKDVFFEWSLPSLIKGQFHAQQLTADYLLVAVVTEPSDEPEQARLVGETLTLPAILTPIPINLSQLSVGQFDLNVNDLGLQFNRIDGAATWFGYTVNIDHFDVEAWQYPFSVAGNISLRAGYPLDATLLITDNNPIKTAAELQAHGSVDDLQLVLDTTGRYALSASGDLQPLTTDVPFAFDADIDEFELATLAEDFNLTLPAIALKGGKISAAGDLQQVAAKATIGHLITPYWADANIDGAAAWRLAEEKIVIEQLSVGSADGTADILGEIDYQKGVGWQLQAVAHDINPVRYTQPYQGKLNFDIDSHGRYEQGLRFSVESSSNNSYFNRLPSQWQLAVTQGREGALVIAPGYIEQGENRIDLVGKVNVLDLEATDTALDIGLLISNASQLYPDIAGRLSGDIHFSGAVTEPSLVTKVSAEAVAFRDFSFAKAIVSSDIQQLAKVGDSQFSLTIDQLNLDQQVLETVQLSVDGNWAAHKIALYSKLLKSTDRQAVEQEQGRYSGNLMADAKIRCRGALSEGFDWRGQCQQLDIGHGLMTTVQRWSLQSPLSVDFVNDDKQPSVSLGDFCFRHQQAKICLTPVQYAKAELAPMTIQVLGIELSLLNQFIDDAVVLDGKVDFSADIALPQRGLTVDAQLAVLGGAARWDNGSTVVDFVADQLDAAFLVKENNAYFDFNFVSDEFGRAQAKAEVLDLEAARDLTGQLNIHQLDLSPLIWLVPDIETYDANINANITLAGQLDDPSLNGELTLTDGKVAGKNLPISISDWQFRAEFNDNDANLSGRFKEVSSGSYTDYSGELTWPNNQWQVAFQLDSDNIRIQLPPEVDMTVSPHLTLLARDRYISLSGEVDIPQALIAIKELPQSAISESGDTVYIDEEGKTDSKWQYDIDVDLRLGDDVRFRGFGADLRFTGGLRASVDGEGILQGLGEIRIAEGEYKAYGQDLSVRKGRFVFNGPISSPDIRLEAIRDITAENIIVGLRVRGRAEEPEVTVFSEPGMDENTAMQYLLTGYGPESEGSGGALSNAAIAMAVSRTQGRVGTVADRLGIQGFQLTTGSGESGTEVQISGYLRPDLYLKYGVSVFENVNTITLRYRLRPKLFLEAMQGATSALDIIYSFETD
ncbi:Translocation and assembly module subunit TamB [Sinobacterium norvegicum]|uniref:Translocation and assembly module subunit TamB n=1 Tax=Sinobacterium norvegicum TaxID=1641715 RepID=A0ABN8EDU4_9GAMM|nr:translocation/assembly module TamB domain-containing protein [Sinobacterium norvegicum]CAH0990614.1 Translocation and assembly module subunit TamB [Sinobacterium norvegicum]